MPLSEHEKERERRAPLAARNARTRGMKTAIIVVDGSISSMVFLLLSRFSCLSLSP